MEEKRALLTKKQRRIYVLTILETIAFFVTAGVFGIFLPSSSGIVRTLIIITMVTSFLLGSATAVAAYKIHKIIADRKKRDLGVLERSDPLL